MKKFFFLLSIAASALQIQAINPDSLNVRHYEDRYYYPEIARSGCIEMPLDIFCDFGNTIKECNDNIVNMYMVPLQGEPFAIDDDRFNPKANLVDDWAQPYTAYAPIKIAGISGFVGMTAGTNDSNYNKLKSYLEIRDNSLENVLASASLMPVPRNQMPYMVGLSSSGSTRYQELFFDSAITVSGDFYVVYHTPDTIEIAGLHPADIEYYITVSFDSIGRCPRYQEPKVCDTNMIWQNSSTYINSYSHGRYGLNIKALYLFPILAEDSVSSCLKTNNDISEFLNIFPNPTKDYVDINCGYKIKTLKIYNEMGIELKDEKIDSYNHRVDLRPYSKGTYIVKVETNMGTATKKVIRQ